jgi:hypothetical protein
MTHGSASPHISGSPLDIVTVVFELEQPLLHLQARSFARYLSADRVANIIVIDNSRPRMRKPFRASLVRDYGRWAERVSVVTPQELGCDHNTSGDRGQQALKLLVADYVQSSRYVVLDAKNHLVAPFSPIQLAAVDGRMKIEFHSYRGHPREAGLRAVLSYFNLDPALIDNFTASTTPFVLETQRVRSLLREVEARESQDFVSGFLATAMTEFPAYTAWLLFQGEALAHHFAEDQQTRPVLWPHLANASGVERMISLASTNVQIFSTHREALARMDRSGAAALASFWAARQLFPDSQIAGQFIAAFKSQRRRKIAFRKVRRIPSRLREEARRTKRSQTGRWTED